MVYGASVPPLEQPRFLPPEWFVTDSGGNRVRKADVETYLKDTLGEAPKVVWGVPGPGGKDNGVGLYAAIAGAFQRCKHMHSAHALI